MTISTTPIHGVVPPVVTPLMPDGSLDTRSLERLVAFLLDAGVDGLFVLGSSGETAYLTDAQRDTVLDVIAGVNARQVPMLAGCIETSTARVIERARIAAKAGVNAIVATAPFYTRTHPIEVDRHFRAVRASVDVPLFAYDVPVSVHVKLSVDLLTTLADDGVLDGVKDSSGDDVGFRQLVLHTRHLPGFAALTGHEVVADAMFLAGAHGVVPGLGNVDPHGYVRLYEAGRRGDWAAAKAEQDRLVRLFSIVDAASPATASGSTAGIGGFKTALALRGIIADATPALPMRALDDGETAEVHDQLVRAGLL